MVKIYVNLVKAGRRTVDEVPAALREAVREALDGDVAAQAEPDLDSMTKHQLRQYAEARGITVYESWNKPEIIAAIQGAE